ncbi:MAG: Lrp/AsnC family transcriptional regulator [Actinomycetota bacterium]|nr:Lrp/AsnC family transcriptional regulator [Actinomycetota bacterium]
MDATDRRILGLLERDARMTYGAVARKVGLAASSVHDRVRKLEKRGVIRGYRADVDLVKAGFPITAFVSLELRSSSPPNIPASVAEFELVESCYSVAGENSYVVVVRAPSTVALEELLDALRAKLDVVTKSTIVLSTPFERRPID